MSFRNHTALKAPGRRFPCAYVVLFIWFHSKSFSYGVDPAEIANALPGQSSLLLDGAFYGLLFGLTIYHLAAAFTRQAGNYLFFSGLAASTFLFMFCANNLEDGYQWTFPTSLMVALTIAFANFALAFLALFSRRSLNLPRHLKRADRWFIFSLVTGVLMQMFSSFPGSPIDPPFVLAIWASFCFTLLAGMGFYRLHHGYTNAPIYLGSMVLGLAGILFYVYELSGQFSISIAPYFGFKVCLGSQLVLLACVLSKDQIKEERDYTESLEKRLTDMEARSVRAIEMEKQMLMLQKQNRDWIVKMAHMGKELENKKAENLVSKARYKSLMEDSPMGIIVIEAEKGLITDVNFQAEEFLQISRNELVGRHHLKLHPPETAKASAQILMNHKESGAPLEQALLFLRGDGETIKVQVTPCFTTINNVRHLQVCFSRASTTESAPLELKQMKHQLDFLLEHTDLWVAIFDTYYQPIVWSDLAEKYSGYTLNELKKVGWESLITRMLPTTKYRKELQNNIDSVRELGIENREQTIYIRTCDNENRIMMWNIVSFSYTEEGDNGFAIIGYDITTESKQKQHIEKVNIAEKRLEAYAEQLRNKLKEMQHHHTKTLEVATKEMRIAIANINKFAEKAKEASEDDISETRKLLLLISRLTKNQNDLIDELVKQEIAVRTSGECMPVKSNFSEVIGLIVASCKPQAAEKELSLQYTEGGSIHANIDKDRIGTAIEEIIGNAIKFSPKGKRILIRLEKRPLSISIIIRDEGLGLDSNDMANLFIPQAKISAEPTAEEGSAGLGLVIAKTLIEQHGGKLQVESKGHGYGSTFTIILPNFEDPTTKAEKKQTSTTKWFGNQ